MRTVCRQHVALVQSNEHHRGDDRGGHAEDDLVSPFRKPGERLGPERGATDAEEEKKHGKPRVERPPARRRHGRRAGGGQDANEADPRRFAERQAEESVEQRHEEHSPANAHDRAKKACKDAGEEREDFERRH